MFADLGLNGTYKVAFAGGHYHHQVIDCIECRVFGMYPLQLLVHGQPQATAYLLQLADPGMAGCQLAQGEHVGVVPAFLQRPHGKDEAQIGVEGEQLFLLLQDQLDGFLLPLFAVRTGKVALVHTAYVLRRALQVGAVVGFQGGVG